MAPSHGDALLPRDAPPTARPSLETHSFRSARPLAHSKPAPRHGPALDAVLAHDRPSPGTPPSIKTLVSRDSPDVTLHPTRPDTHTQAARKRTPAQKGGRHRNTARTPPPTHPQANARHPSTPYTRNRLPPRVPVPAARPCRWWGTTRGCAEGPPAPGNARRCLSRRRCTDPPHWHWHTS
ncbi:hypothetical protein BJY18_006922 [Amycolatopsis jiangsuensis]|uniref:Uncharacterized protein n=1 Tax=Amycolatopsis jiangsuensis TaxID=1181879 RepID=A0A840J7S8_9PSEU|nr:hypothetical protein [Amycolatopsis jiangsuensis]